MVPDYPRLLREGRPWIQWAFGLFLFGAMSGYLLASSRPDMAATQLRSLVEVLQGIGQRVIESESPFERTFIIFENNTIAALRMMAGGAIIGLLPALGTLSNGFLVGVILVLAGQSGGVSGTPVSPMLLAISVLPHGIIELPALWLATAWGMRLGLVWLGPAGKGRRLAAFGQVGLETVQMFLLVVVLLAIAAAIEANVTLALMERLH